MSFAVDAVREAVGEDEVEDLVGLAAQAPPHQLLVARLRRRRRPRPRSSGRACTASYENVTGTSASGTLKAMFGPLATPPAP